MVAPRGKKVIFGENGEPVPVAKNAKALKKRHSGPKKGRIKASTARRLKRAEPQLVEGPKNALFLKGTKTSPIITECLKDLKKLKAPNAKLLAKRNECRPFEEETSVEFLCTKNECALFAFGAHSKKRPNNLVLGRTFDKQIMDMIELGIKNFKATSSFKGRKKQVGSKPCFVFTGDEWDREEKYSKLKNLLVDFFRGEVVEHVHLAGLDHVAVCTLVKDVVYVRHYSINYKKSGTKLPRVELEPMGPFMDLEIRRTRFASGDVVKASLQKAKGLEEKKRKNISRDDATGEKLGRIHMGRQDLSSMNVKKSKALRPTAAEKNEKKRSRDSTPESSLETVQKPSPKKRRD